MSNILNNQSPLGIYKRDPLEIAKTLRRHSAPVSKSKLPLLNKSSSSETNNISSIKNMLPQISIHEIYNTDSDLSHENRIQMIEYKFDSLVEVTSNMIN
jgi:hypothetical protein